MKALCIILVSSAVIASAIAIVVSSTNRTAQARYAAEAECAAADKAEAQAKEAAKQAEAEENKRKAAEAEKEAKIASQKTAQIEKETAELNAKAQEDVNKAAKEQADEAKSRALEAKSRADAEKAKLAAEREKKEAAKFNAEAEASREKAAADKLQLEKLKSEREIAEAKLLELRKIDFINLERQLLDWKSELEEREKALEPEKTITDLAWAGGKEDSVLDENGNVVKREKEVYLLENDKNLPKAERALAKAQRLDKEEFAYRATESRDKIVSSLEKLYVQALREDRVTDAQFYRKTIHSIMPTWKLTLPEEEKSAGGKK